MRVSAMQNNGRLLCGFEKTSRYKVVAGYVPKLGAVVDSVAINWLKICEHFVHTQTLAKEN